MSEVSDKIAALLVEAPYQEFLAFAESMDAALVSDCPKGWAEERIYEWAKDRLAAAMESEDG